MAKRVMIVGAGWDQVPMIKEIQRRGFVAIALDGNAAAPGLSIADKSHTVSTRDADGVLAVAIAERIDAITYMITESPLPAMRQVCDVLGLPGPSITSVRTTVSKLEMRRLFERVGIPNPMFDAARTLEEARAAAGRIGFPLVIKPADLGGQIGLARIGELEELIRHYDGAQQASVAREVILEELLVGPEVNVVAVVARGTIVESTTADRLTHGSLGFGVVMRHLYPAACNKEMLVGVRELCQSAIAAMGVKDGIVFPQLILTSSGPRIVEIGERIPGGVMKELFEFATGIDLVSVQLDISLGKKIELESYRRWPSSAAVTVKFLTAEPGRLMAGPVKSWRGKETALTMDGVVAADFYNNPRGEQTIRPLRCGRDRFFFVVAVGGSREEAVMRSNRAAAELDFFDEKGESLLARDLQNPLRFEP